MGLVDWYAHGTGVPYPLESTGTWLPYAQDDAVKLQESCIAALGNGVWSLIMLGRMTDRVGMIFRQIVVR